MVRLQQQQLFLLLLLRMSTAYPLHLWFLISYVFNTKHPRSRSPVFTSFVALLWRICLQVLLSGLVSGLAQHPCSSNAAAHGIICDERPVQFCSATAVSCCLHRSKSQEQPESTAATVLAAPRRQNSWRDLRSHAQHGAACRSGRLQLLWRYLVLHLLVHGVLLLLLC